MLDLLQQQRYYQQYLLNTAESDRLHATIEFSVVDLGLLEHIFSSFGFWMWCCWYPDPQ